ncbi:LysM peptidoglycan-binding domain-containing protein [Arthrobacter sp. ISL-5]|uniref:LysM peptidoglycan-binding domain-containing protein n=1 Tax=Arthrobacter sp. ISL-5 TaxID=2819111 RepID=UPI001BE67722|nr:LysM peptidoglycan-binding domain-containing protein [Arthrobacter sp. ISL-5]MBT2554232.1 LysM peptidoglycan-binding domain-containing protein [Arthrobacter sp. ISL-5]
MSASTVTSVPAAVQCSHPQGRVTAARQSSLQGPRRSTTVIGQAAKPPRLRLTRRGRIVLIGMPLVLLAAILLSLAGLLNSPAKAADTASGLAVTPAVSVTVQPGESLWAIAGAVDPGRDPRDVIADIVQLNDLEGGRVMPGQQLFVPSK